MTNESNSNLLLDIRNLRIDGFSDRGWQPILRGIDLKLRRGEVLGLIGESGAGKSTLGKAAMGYVQSGCRITSGQILFGGVDLTSLSDIDKRRLWGTRLTYVAQSAAASFNPARRLIDQTVRPTVREGIHSLKDARSRAIALFKAMALSDPERIGKRFPHQISGGQLQRVMTAMAMLPRPDLIIFDEPTTALDVTTQVEVLAAMRKIVRENGTAAVYITHDLAVVAQMADRIKVMRHGREIEEAPTRHMLAMPKEAYTKSLWAVKSLRGPTRPETEAVLAIQDVCAGYDRLSVLDNVNLRLLRGRTVAVVGESGSGKSTLARVISGLLPPMSGTVTFDGKTLPARMQMRTKDQLRRIQLIYQMADTAINPRQKVSEIVGRPLTFYHSIVGQALERRVKSLLNDIELDESIYDRFPAELSGGQKQRVCIARALAADPEIILCDEITSALDQIVQEGILKLITRLQRERNISYLFITHDLAIVEAIADQIVVMHQGKVIEQGDKCTILSPPHPDYTKVLLSSVPQIDPDWLTRRIDQNSRR